MPIVTPYLAAVYACSSSAFSIVASRTARPSTTAAVWAIATASVSAATASRCQAAVNAEAAGPRQPWSPPVSRGTSWFSAVMTPAIRGR